MGCEMRRSELRAGSVALLVAATVVLGACGGGGGGSPQEAVPLAPALVQAAPQSSENIWITWMDKADNESHYVVQRSVAGGPFDTLNDALPADAESLSDDGLDPATSYAYKVYAVNGAGASPEGGPASATTLPATAVRFSITLPASPDTAEEYDITLNAEVPEGTQITGPVFIQESTSKDFTTDLQTHTWPQFTSPSSWPRTHSTARTYYYRGGVDGNLSGVVSCVVAEPGITVTVTLAPTADNYVAISDKDAWPWNKYGSRVYKDSSLKVGIDYESKRVVTPWNTTVYEYTHRYASLLKFDLSKVDGTPTKAVLTLYGDHIPALGGAFFYYEAVRLTSAWNPSTATGNWFFKNTPYTTVGLVRKDRPREGEEAWDVDVTDIVKAWKSGSSNYGVAVYGTPPISTGSLPYSNTFYSTDTARDADFVDLSDYAPVLEVTYTK